MQSWAGLLRLSVAWFYLHSLKRRIEIDMKVQIQFLNIWLHQNKMKELKMLKLMIYYLIAPYAKKTL